MDNGIIKLWKRIYLFTLAFIKTTKDVYEYKKVLRKICNELDRLTEKAG